MRIPEWLGQFGIDRKRWALTVTAVKQLAGENKLPSGEARVEATGKASCHYSNGVMPVNDQLGSSGSGDLTTATDGPGNRSVGQKSP